MPTLAGLDAMDCSSLTLESNRQLSTRGFAVVYNSHRSDTGRLDASPRLQPLLLPKAISQNGWGSPRTMAALRESDSGFHGRIKNNGTRLSTSDADAADDDFGGLPHFHDSLVGTVAGGTKKPTSQEGTSHLYEGIWADALKHEDEYSETSKEGKKPLAFVEGNTFQTIASTVILINSIAIGVATDRPSVWGDRLEVFVLSFFVFELCARIFRHGLILFLCPGTDDSFWNVLDFALVVVGVFDEWIMPLVGRMEGADDSSDNSVSATYVKVFRVLRLLRIVRLIRLVKMVRPLFEMAQGILEALQGIFWVLVFILMFVYAISILATRLIGHGVVSKGDTPELIEIRGMFGSVDESMFVLFELMSCWGLMRFERLFDLVPATRPCFVLFYVLAAWALLAVMTGVVSFNMISMKTKMNEEDTHRDQLRKMYATDLLTELFIEADEDNSGEVSRQEFQKMLCSKTLMRKIMKNTNVKVQDLDDLFDWIDHDGSNSVTISEFMDGFSCLNEPMSTKSLLKIERKVDSELKRVWKTLNTKLEHHFGHMTRSIEPSLRKINAVAQQVHILEATFRGVRNHLLYAKEVQEQDKALQQNVSAIESRLGRQLNEIVARLDRLEIKLVGGKRH